MKKFIIKVNGKSYEVEVEEIGQGEKQKLNEVTPNITPTPVQPKNEIKPETVKAKPQPEPKRNEEVKPVPQGAGIIEAPMSGTIVDIKVKEGDTVTEGQVVVILEAMKMENEIPATRNGKVVAVNVTKGSTVNAGEPLISLE